MYICVYTNTQDTHTHIHTHTHIYIYTRLDPYKCLSLCVSVCPLKTQTNNDCTHFVIALPFLIGSPLLTKACGGCGSVAVGGGGRLRLGGLGGNAGGSLDPVSSICDRFYKTFLAVRSCWRCDIRYNDTHYNDTRQNASQHNNF
jgi:hypothetical protein